MNKLPSSLKSIESFIFNNIFENNILNLEIKNIHLNEVLELLEASHIKLKLIDICGIDSLNLIGGAADRFSVHYHFINVANFERYIFKISISDKCKIKSIRERYTFAQFLEDEVFDMFGIEFTLNNESCSKRILTNNNITGFPLKKDFSYKEKKHEAIKENIHIPLSLKGGITSFSSKVYFEVDEGIITKTYYDMGKKHIGLESLCESNSYQDNLRIINKYNSLGSYNNTFSYLKTIEEFFEITVPDKAKALRMILSELTRISDHFNCLGLWALECGHNIVYHDTIQAREMILNLFELYSGNRVPSNTIIIGGMKEECPLGWHLKCLDIIALLSKLLTGIKRQLEDTSSWHKRNLLGIVSAKKTFENGMSGPCLRASGVNYDIRKRYPYYFYDEIDFHIPLGSNGSNFERYLMRTHEIKQSFNIIVHLIDGLPFGKSQNLDHILIDPAEQSLKKGSYYSAIESSSGELGHYLVSDGEDRPYRLHIVPPNLGHTGLYKDMTKGLSLDDAGIVFRSLSINSCEVER